MTNTSTRPRSERGGSRHGRLRAFTAWVARWLRRTPAPARHVVEAPDATPARRPSTAVAPAPAGSPASPRPASAPAAGRAAARVAVPAAVPASVPAAVPAAIPAAVPAAVPAAAARPEPALEMAREVRGLLEAHPRAREVFRHLGLLERALRCNGLRVFDQMSLRVVEQALRQLEGLVSDWNPPLAELRRRLAARVGAGAASAQDTLPQAFDRSVRPVGGRTHVAEVAMEDYVSALAYYEATMPMPPSFGRTVT